MVFGEVVSGQEVVTHIEGLPVDRMSRPLQDAKVVNCGELVLKVKNKTKKKETKQSSSSDSDSDSYSGKSKKKKKNKKSKKRAKSEDGEIHDSNEDDSTKPHPLVSVTKIDPDEIPEVPANKFLYRAGPTNNANQKEFRQHYGRDRVRSHRKSGRMFKGRGIFRYHTPSRSRSRSVTPPHWKQAQNRTIKLHEFQKLEKERMKKEEDQKKREADRIKKFGENPEEDQTMDKFEDNAHIPEELENKENDQVDEKNDDKSIEQDQENVNTNMDVEDGPGKDKTDVKQKEEKLVKQDANRPYEEKSSRRESRDRSRRRGSGRSRSRDRRRSRDRDYVRRRSRDRRNRRNYSPRRRETYRMNRPGRDGHRYYEKRNDYRKTNNSNSHHDADLNSARYEKNRQKKNDSAATDSNVQAKFKRRSRSSSSSSQHSKD